MIRLRGPLKLQFTPFNFLFIIAGGDCDVKTKTAKSFAASDFRVFEKIAGVAGALHRSGHLLILYSPELDSLIGLFETGGYGLFPEAVSCCHGAMEEQNLDDFGKLLECFYRHPPSVRMGGVHIIG